MSVIALGAESAYASKPNIQRPGTQADADLAEAEVQTRVQDAYKFKGVSGDVVLVSLDTADLAIVGTTETTKTSIPHASN